ncbi:FMN-binding protein [Peptoniphilus sp. GNH]|nr:FMN-binding protein [Peptoniphilus sp. GNH]
MSKKLVTVSLIATFLLSGCGNKNAAPKNNKAANENSAPAATEVAYKDGEYTKDSEPDKYGGYMTATVTVKDGKITDAKLVLYNGDGSEKDENYGKENGEIKNQEMYDKAQASLEGAKDYPKQLVEKQDITKVDSVTGATQNHDAYVELVSKMLEDAKAEK